MNFKQRATLFLAVTIAITNSVKGSVISAAEINKSLVNFLSHSNELFSGNLVRSADCFNNYLELFTEITKSYQGKCEACIEASKNASSEAEAATLDIRKGLALNSGESCNMLSQCDKKESAIEVLQCYIDGGKLNSKKMHQINGDATGHLSALQAQFLLIENREKNCTNNAQTIYETEILQAYDNLNKCKLHIDDETTKAPEVTESTESTENPEIPESSSESSEKPESTESPENPAGTEGNFPQTQLPEEDLSLRQLFRTRFNI